MTSELPDREERARAAALDAALDQGPKAQRRVGPRLPTDDLADLAASLREAMLPMPELPSGGRHGGPRGSISGPRGETARPGQIARGRRRHPGRRGAGRCGPLECGTTAEPGHRPGRCTGRPQLRQRLPGQAQLRQSQAVHRTGIQGHPRKGIGAAGGAPVHGQRDCGD